MDADRGCGCGVSSSSNSNQGPGILPLYQNSDCYNLCGVQVATVYFMQCTSDSEIAVTLNLILSMKCLPPHVEHEGISAVL